MKVFELLNNYTFDQVRPKLLELYPEQANSMKGYEVAYAELRNDTEVIHNVSQIHLYDVVDEDDPDDSYTDVYSTNGDGDHYAVDFVDWREVLGMTLSPDIYNDYTDLEALVHILFEVTWYGYSNEEVQSESAELDKVLAEIKQDLAENGSSASTLSLEEVLAEFDK
jgi:hypothetical protein